MQSMSICPRCRVLLADVGNSGRGHQCGRCGGRFIDAAQIPDNDELGVGTAHALTDELTHAAHDALSCPHCLQPMTIVQRSGQTTYVCHACQGRWIDATPDPEANDAPGTDPAPAGAAETAPSTTTQNLLYGLSLPERLVRSAVGLTAGAAVEIAEFVVPQAFQSSKSYEIAISNSLGFLTETIGGVEGKTKQEDDAGEHIARKAVGNFIDLAGLATLHVSPMWILAVVSDVAYGTRTYVSEVANELQKQGVIDDTSTIHNVDDILDAIQRASGTTASNFDKPPLSVAELRETVDETRQHLQHADVRKLIPQAEMSKYWNEMQRLALEEDVSVMDVSAAITMNTLSQVQTVSNGALTGVRVAGGLFNKNVLSHYGASLRHIREYGFYKTVSDSYQPYVDAVWTNFSGAKKTWTESLLDPNNVSNGLKKAWSLLEGRAAGGAPTEVEPPVA